MILKVIFMGNALLSTQYLRNLPSQNNQAFMVKKKIAFSSLNNKATKSKLRDGYF